MVFCFIRRYFVWEKNTASSFGRCLKTLYIATINKILMSLVSIQWQDVSMDTDMGKYQ